MNAPMHPISLPFAQSVSFEVITAQRTMLNAVMTRISVSGRDAKAIYIDLEIDKGHWSRIMDAKAHFPIDKLERLMDLCGNDIPLQWLAWRRGKGLHLLESEQQRLIRQKDDQIAHLNQKVEWLTELVRK
jgi:hypothetical protein